MKKIDWIIVKKSTKGNLSEEERRAFDDWLNDSPSHKEFFENSIHFKATSANSSTYKEEFEAKLNLVASRKRIKRIKRITVWSSVAAVLILFFTFPTRISDYTDRLIELSDPFKQGEKKALLIIDNKETIVLDEQSNLPTTKLVKTSGQISYKESATVSEQVKNRLVTPRGCEYSIVLNDGSVVWLNADSELIFPEKFSETERRVELRGEAYFDVAKESERQFIVTANHVDIKVYGTQFNVLSRDEQTVNTVLIEGSVGVEANGREQKIEPNEMVVYHCADSQFVVSQIDVAKYTAWRNREYCFEDEKLDEILKELSLWYDFDIVYENSDLKELKFSCHIQRKSDFKEILNYFERTGHVKFSIEDRRLIVK